VETSDWLDRGKITVGITRRGLLSEQFDRGRIRRCPIARHFGGMNCCRTKRAIAVLSERSSRTERQTLATYAHSAPKRATPPLPNRPPLWPPPNISGTAIRVIHIRAPSVGWEYKPTGLPQWHGDHLRTAPDHTFASSAMARSIDARVAFEPRIWLNHRAGPRPRHPLRPQSEAS